MSFFCIFFNKTFAYPLEQITGTADLKSEIIEKLLKIAENIPEAAEPEIPE